MNYEPPTFEPNEEWAKALKEMENFVFKINMKNGWFEGERTFGDDIALLHSEVSEMLEAYRSFGTEDATLPPRVDGIGRQTKPEGIGSEAADVLVRLLDTCRRWEIDLAYEFQRKCAYNETRGHRHGGKKL